MLRLRCFLALAFGLTVGLSSTSARALENSELEERSVTRVLGPAPDRDPAPEGKRIESVQIVRLPVFDEDDPVPDFVNALHAQTRQHVIRRELLFRDGDRYSGERVQETIRNLQLLPQFGVVVVVAVRSPNPDRVRVVVIVRDVWSLRANYSLEGRPTSINYLLLNLSEDNFLGTRTRVGGLFTLQPDRYSGGGLLVHPRVLGSKVDVAAQGRVFVNLESGKAEGSTGTLAVYRELLALSDKWAFLVGSGWLVEQTRIFSDRVPYLTKSGVPLAYHSSVVRGGAELTRSFGNWLKVDLTFGVELNRRKFEATRRPQDSAAAYAEFLRNDVPVSDTRLSPFVLLEHRTARYLATRDVETLALQESFALGPVAALRLYPAARSLGSSRDLLGSVAWVGYTAALKDGLLRGLVSSNIEATPDARQQASAQTALRVVSPRWGFARLVLDSALVSTYQNYLNRKLALGGDTRPRGYRSASLRGDSGFAASVEARSSSVNVWSARVGVVAFYDVGGAGRQVADIKLKQSVGAGVRILFPQVNRQVFRVDWAAPLSAVDSLHQARPLPGAIYFTFGQAFDMPKVKLPAILGAETTLLEVAQ